jgi:hypothetical protein
VDDWCGDFGRGICARCVAGVNQSRGGLFYFGAMVRQSGTAAVYSDYVLMVVAVLTVIAMLLLNWWEVDPSLGVTTYREHCSGTTMHLVGAGYVEFALFWRVVL